MFQRFHEMRERREGGFTLIELLVVILIIAILAAIAIPVFLRQREKGWVAQVESALKNAATAQESYLVEEGVYATTLAQLEGEEGDPGEVGQGLKYAADVQFDEPFGTDEGRSYCMEAGHLNLGDRTWSFDSAVGAPTEAPCTE